MTNYTSVSDLKLFSVAVSHVLIFLGPTYSITPMWSRYCNGATIMVYRKWKESSLSVWQHESGCYILILESGTPERHVCHNITVVSVKKEAVPVFIPLTRVFSYSIALTTDWIRGCPLHCFYLITTLNLNCSSSTIGKAVLIPERELQPQKGILSVELIVCRHVKISLTPSPPTMWFTCSFYAVVHCHIFLKHLKIHKTHPSAQTVTSHLCFCVYV